MSRYARLLNDDHDQTNPTPHPSNTHAASPSTPALSSMLTSLKESAASAGGSVRENMGRASDSVRSGLGIPAAGGADDDGDARSESSGMLDEVSEICPKLTYHQRIMGFGITFACGYLMTFMSFRLFIKLVEGNPAPFVFLYTSGNVMSLASSMFLSGPKRQCQSMFDEKRRLTSATYLVSLACSIAVCFIPIPTGPKIGLLVLLLLVQMMASLWYTLSYVPYGRAGAKRMLKSFMAGEE